MIYIIWLVLFSLFVFSFLNPEFPIWIPVLAYTLVVVVRVKEKIGNYKDWIDKSYRDEERTLSLNLENFENKSLASSGERLKQEDYIKKDFESDRKKRKRQRDTELIDCLFLKK